MDTYSSGVVDETVLIFSNLNRSHEAEIKTCSCKMLKHLYVGISQIEFQCLKKPMKLCYCII